MKNKKRIICYFLSLLVLYFGCSTKDVSNDYSVIATIPVSSLGIRFLLFKGSPDVNASNIYKNTFFITHMDSIDRARYPNLFSPMEYLGIRMLKSDSVKIELLNPNKEFILLIYTDELEEGYYSLVLENGNYSKKSFKIRVTKGSKSWLYDFSIN